MQRDEVAIIGGGYTGLTAAYRLAQSDVPVVVYEREPRVGGLAVGFELDGIPLEKIWHFLYMSDTHALRLAEELGVRDRLVFHESSISTYYDGELYPFMTPVDLIRFRPLPFIDRVRTGFVALYLKYLRNWKPLTRVTAYEWMKKRAGRRATRVIWEPLLRGKFGPFYDRVIMSWLWGRVKVRQDSSEESGERLGYFRGGFGLLTEGLREGIERHGGKIHTGVSVERISKQADGTIAVAAGERSGTYRDVLVTSSTRVFRELIRENDEVTDDYLARLASIDYVGAAVMVFTSEQEISPYYWHNVNDPDIPFLVFLSNSILAGRETYSGKNLYYIGFYAPDDHRYFTEPEESVMAEWEEGLARMFPDFDAAQIRKKAFFRFRDAQHIVDLGYEERIPPYESPVPHVYLANFSQIYPEDRGLNFAIREGEKLAEMIRKRS